MKQFLSQIVLFVFIEHLLCAEEDAEPWRELSYLPSKEMWNKGGPHCLVSPEYVFRSLLVTASFWVLKPSALF